jgi:hypothetical protein
MISLLTLAAPDTQLVPGRPSASPQNIEDGPDDILLLRKRDRSQYQIGLGVMAGNFLVASESLSQSFLDLRWNYRDTVKRSSLFSLGLTQKSHFLIELGSQYSLQEAPLGIDYWKLSLATLLVPSEGLSSFGTLNRVQLQTGLGSERLFGSKINFEGSLSYALIGFGIQLRFLYPLTY